MPCPALDAKRGVEKKSKEGLGRKEEVGEQANKQAAALAALAQSCLSWQANAPTHALRRSRADETTKKKKKNKMMEETRGRERRTDERKKERKKERAKRGLVYLLAPLCLAFQSIRFCITRSSACVAANVG